VEVKWFRSEPKREAVNEKSPWGITESIGGRAAGVIGLGGWEAGAFDGEVGRIGRSLARRG